MNLSINEYLIIRPPFPPNITAQELLKYKSIPNSFMIYRIACRKECISKNITIERKFVSKIASNLWKLEPASVKNTYIKIVNDAKILDNMIQRAIPSGNIFIPSPPLLQQENPFSYSTLEQQSKFENLTPPVLNSSDLAPDVNIKQCAQNLEQSSCQLLNNNGYSIGNFSAYFPYLPQENPFTHGGLNIEQRIQTLIKQFDAFYQILIKNGYGIVAGSGTDYYANIEQLIQILELQKGLFYQTLVHHGIINIAEQGIIEIFSTPETLNIEQRIQSLEKQINSFNSFNY